MLIDLQLHSIYSDGYLTPTKLVDFIASQGVKAAALTDHNTVSGLNEFKAACARKKIKAVSGLELYVKLNHHKMNLLWYNFDFASPDLHSLLRESQVRRRAKVRNLLEKLFASKFKFDINKILDKYNHYIPVNHVISEIIDIPFNANKIKRELGLKNPREEEIMRHYFSNRNIGVLRESYLDIRRIFKLRQKIGGQIILCHPAKYNYINKEIWAKLAEMGLDGTEVLSPHHSYGAIVYIQQLARDFNLIETGGSDFHRFEGGNFSVQKSWDYFKIDAKYLNGIKKIIG
jgi:3',5'-nucleoside bisphosphate phosphatase